MSIGKHARSMAAALMIGATILGLTTEPAGAESKQPKDDGVRCSMEGNLHDPPQEEDQVLYTPGEWAAAQAGAGRLLAWPR